MGFLLALLHVLPALNKEEEAQRVLDMNSGLFLCQECSRNYENDPNKPAERALSAQSAYIMTSILQDVIKTGTGRRALELKRNDLAGKTGTTQNKMDAWFTGFNQSLVTFLRILIIKE